MSGSRGITIAVMVTIQVITKAKRGEWNVDTLSSNKRLNKSLQTWDTWHGKHTKERRGIITVNISSTNRALNQHKRPPQI